MRISIRKLNGKLGEPDIQIGNRILIMGYRHPIRAAEIVGESSAGNVEVLDSAGDITKLKYNLVLHPRDPSFSSIFVPQSLLNMDLPNSSPKSLHGRRVLSINDSGHSSLPDLEVGTIRVVKNLSYIDTDGSTRLLERDDQVWDITDNLFFTVKARGLTRVSRLNLGDRDY